MEIDNGETVVDIVRVGIALTGTFIGAGVAAYYNERKKNRHPKEGKEDGQYITIEASTLQLLQENRELLAELLAMKDQELKTIKEGN